MLWPHRAGATPPRGTPELPISKARGQPGRNRAFIRRLRRPTSTIMRRPRIDPARVDRCDVSGRDHGHKLAASDARNERVWSKHRSPGRRSGAQL